MDPDLLREIRRSQPYATGVTTSSACPTEHTVLACVLEQRVGDLAEHMDTCESCREVVAELARGSGDASASTNGVPEIIGRFRIEQRLGAGAMGVVYLASDPRLQRLVALKVLHDAMPGQPTAQRMSRRLIEEARAMARIDHENLVTVFEVEEVAGQVAIAMEYLRGGTLRAKIAAQPRWQETVSIMRDVARGLSAIHGAGLIHRDLKPDNILFGADGRPRIADLGLATQHQAHGQNGLIGTPVYMAPEQHAGGPADERSDQWSFFVCLYEVLCGKRPTFESASNASGAAGGGNDPPATLGPRRLRALIARGLQRDPAARHGSMAEVADALDRFLRRPTRRVMIALGAMAVAAVGVSTVLASRHHIDPPCSDGQDALASVWNAPAAARLGTAFARNGMTATGTVVLRGIGDYTAAWSAMHAENCAATRIRGEQSETLLDRRTVCLRERLAQVDAVITILSSADPATLARGGEAIATLPPVDECAAPASLAAGRLPSLNPIDSARQMGAHLALGRALALRPLGQSRQTIVDVEPVIATAVAIADHVLEAEARLALADALAEDRQLERARAEFAQTELAAEIAGSDELRARTLVAHATLVGALQQHPAASKELLDQARAVVLRLGGHPDLDRRVLVASAAVTIADGDPRGGEKLLRTALATLPETGPERVLRITALRDLANVLGDQGRHEEASVFARQAVTLAEATLGPDHIDVAETLSMLSLTLHFTGNDAEARVLAARALEIKERAHGIDHVSLSSTLMVLAEIERDSGLAGSHAETRRLTDRAIELRRVAYGGDNPLLLSLVGERGSLAVDAGEFAIARASFAAAIPGLEAAWGVASPAVTQAKDSEATMAEQSGDPEGCALRLGENAATVADTEGPTSPRLHALGIRRAYCLLLAKAFVRAEEVVEETARFELEPDERASLALVASRLALARGNRVLARAIASDVEIRLAKEPPRAEDAPDLDLDLGMAWAKLEERQRAWPHVERAIAAVGDDLVASGLLARGAEIALELARDEDATRLAMRAISIAVANSAGPDMLAHYQHIRALALRSRPTH
ncbi:hypothetical protein BH11MYX2_BH11MYX2_11960 [soil metagenome]